MTVTDTERTTPEKTGPEPGGPVLAHITPNWFGAVMGTGIVATAAASLPYGAQVLRPFALLMWAIAAVFLVILVVAFVGHWLHHPENARTYARHPMMSHFYGAPAMALLTVGAATLLVGRDIIGLAPAVWIDGVLWGSGTALGVGISVWLPYSMMTRNAEDRVHAMPSWLMSVVAPMASATTGALLIPHVADGQSRVTVLCACYALFGASLFLGGITLTLVYSRAVYDGAPAGSAAPTFWITLGLIGQSITAANLLGHAARDVFTGDRRPIGVGLEVFGIGYGLTMTGFGMIMFTLAVAVTVRAARRRMPFAISWWSFTFPVGTCVTGTAALGKVLVDGPIEALSMVLFTVLVAAWLVVAAMTVARHRELLAPTRGG